MPRFLYLNTYAFFLLALGIGIGVVPCYRIGWWLVGIQVILGLVCIYKAIEIFYSWADKKRKYKVLMERNNPVLRPDTFTDYMQAPCGRLLVRVVLQDLGCPQTYQQLKALRKPFKETLKENCRPQKTIIYYPSKKI